MEVFDAVRQRLDLRLRLIIDLEHVCNLLLVQ
ncbi:unnamed protein product [Anisakis simplex]|uniref:Transcriptional regulator n=1 Tax=Anisakis simplex TaxID=6269 RepID=A0A0M3K3B9_ANISI|nr:unnamed protein product [Anisakis simplex]